MGTAEYRENWRRLLDPRSIALVGASDSGFAAGNIRDNLKRAGYGGEIYPINPGRPAVFGMKSYPSLAEAPRADVAVMLLGRERVEESVAQAIAAGVGGVVIVAGGFRESREPEWIAAEARISAAARAADVPLIGPNCLGVMAIPAGAMMVIAPYPWPTRSGSISMLMQSGGQLLAGVKYVNYLGAGVRFGLSLGNATTISFAEAIAVLADDPETREIVLLIEEIGDWPRFREAVLRARAAGKWIAAIAIGKTQSGQRAAATHTGAIAVDHEILSSALAQLGVRVGETLGPTLGAAVLQSRFGDPAPGSIGVAGVSGGGGGLAGDLASLRSAPLARLSAGTVSRIEAINPNVRADNPIDIISGPLEKERFRAVYEAFLQDADVGVGLYLPSQGVPDDDLPGHLETMASVASVAESTGVPVVISSVIYSPIPESKREWLLANKTICLLPSIEDAFAALAIWRSGPLQLIDIHRSRAGAHEPGRDVEPARAARQPVDEAALKKLLAAHGCRSPQSLVLSRSAAIDGAAAWDRIAYPVVVKGVGRDILHKAKLGFVALGVGDQADASAAMARMAQSPEGERIEAFLVERQADPGVDVMVSVLQNRMGAVLVLSEGGGRAGEAGLASWMAVDPTREELIAGARHLLGQLGAAGQAERLADFAAAAMAARAAESFSLLEINPARILPSGEIVALDAVALSLP